MAGLPPGDPKLVSMIVNHLKTQGLFDQFRRDCLADVDTKPAYLNLRQRVDNFVSNHLSNHTWSPHLNKNQLRNNIRQLVLQSGMLEAGVDRIITQVVDPKIHHKFKPQVERVVHDYLTSINQKESDQLVSSAQIEEKQDYFIATPGTSSGPSTTVASDAMSILDTITSLNQEASAAWASTESIAGKSVDRTARRSSSQIADGGLEKDKYLEESLGKEKADLEEAAEESCAVEETPENALQASKDAVHTAQETSDPIEPSNETAEESEDPENMSDKREEGKEKNVSKTKEAAAAAAAAPAEKEGEEQTAPSEKHIIKQKARERLKEEYSLEDSDLEGLSDISVSSVHTSDLSSFDEESEEEPPLSDSTEEGEITSEDEEYQETQTNSTAKQENEDRKPRAGRQAYVHKPFLYSKYYSDSDDEVTVEQRRRSIAKDKEERLLKRQQNREKLEERRKHKAAEKGKHQEALHSIEQDKVQRKTGTVSPSSDSQGASVKEALKEQKVLEKKVAISRRRKRNSRKDGDDGTSQKRKREPEDEFKEILKKAEQTQETYAKEPKPSSSKSQLLKPVRRLSESVQPAEESKHEHRRKRSGSTVSTSPQAEETTAEAGELKEPKKLPEKVKVHSFLSDLDPSYDESYKPRVTGKNEKHLKKETISDAETESGKKKEVKHPKEKSEKERSLLDDKVKHKSKSDKAQKAGDAAEHHVSEGKGMENLQKDSGHQAKAASDEKSDRKSKVRNDRKCSTSFKDIRLVISEATSEDVLHKDGTRKVKISLAEQPKAEQKVKGDRSSVRSDTKVQLSAGCSLKENPVFQNKVESSSEDRSDIELGSESGRKKEKLLKDIKKRTKSYSDDRHAEKVRSRAENKEAKASDKEGLGPESKSKVDQSSKDSHNTEKSHLGADVDRKSKDCDSCLEVKAATESESEPTGRSVSSSQRDSSHKFKAEKPASKSAKVTSSSKTEKKSQGTEHKSKSAKPSHRLETLKERKKESGIKEEKKAPVEKSQVKTKEDIQEIENEQESKEVKKTVDKKFSIKEIESDKRKGSTSVLQVSDSLTDVSEQEGSTTEGSSTSPQDIEVADNLTHSVQENVPVDMDMSLTGTHGSAASETTEPGQGASVCRSESDRSGLEGKGKPTEIISKTVSAKDNSRALEAVDTVSCETAASDLTLELEAKTPVAAVPVVGGTGSGQEMKEAEAESSKQDTPASKEIEVELGDPAPVPEDETNEETSKTIEEADFQVKNVELVEELATPVEIKYNQEGEVDHVDQQEAATEGVCKEERKEVQSTGDVSVHEELPIINLPSSDSLTSIKQRTEQPAPVSIQEHEEPDMKTKEAALALLSMDPQIPAQVEEEETQTQLLTEAIPPVMHDAQQETSLMEADVGGLSCTQKSDIIPGNECLGAAERKESALLAGELEEKKEDTGEMVKVEPSLGTDKTEEPLEKDTAHKDEATNESESIEKDKGTSGTTSQDKQEAEIKDPSEEGKTPRRGRPPKTSAARVKGTADGQVSGHHVETKMGEKKDSPLISPDEGNTDIPLAKDKTDHTESSERNPATETGKTCSKLEATEETEMSAETSVEENKPEGLEKETSQENDPKRAQWQQLQTTGDKGQQCLGQELEMKEESKESEIKSDNGKAETTDKKRRGRGRPKRVSVSSEPMLVKEEEAERKVESAEKLEESKESDQSENEKRTAGAEMPTEEPSLVKGAGEPSVNKDETGEAEDQISDKEEERKSARRGRPSGKHTKKEDDEKEERKKDDVDEKEQNSDLSEPEDELVEDKRPLRRGRSSETPARAKGTTKQSRSDKEHIMDQSEDEEDSEKVRETKPCKGRHSKPGKETSKTPNEENKDDDQKFESDEESEKETKPPRRGRSSKQSSTPLKETGKSSKEKEEEKAENSGDEKKSENVEKKTPVRRGRRSAAQGKETGNQDEAEEKPGVDSDQKQDEKEDERTEQKIPGRRGRPPKQLSKETDKPSKMQNEEKDRQTPDADSKDEEEPENDSKVTKRGRAKCPPKESKDTSKSTRKRMRSEESEESDDENEPEKAEDQKPAPKKRPPKRACSDSGSPTEEQGDEEEDDEEEEESTNDTKARNDEDKEKTMEKKNVRRRSSKGSPAEESEKQDSEKKDNKTELEGKEDEEGDDDEEEREEEEETQIRATTRSASRLEAERNKPSKPPTRAVRKLDTSDSVREKPSTSAKEKASPAPATTTRSRVQPSPASKQGRKRETSPPVVRTRGGQKTEEPPSKRTKR